MNLFRMGSKLSIYQNRYTKLLNRLCGCEIGEESKHQG